ncbi:DUF3891 family protein [Mucisphaera calidilacus]|uniref:DUF3891 family protein n=1 Tax=Mucisphaera calidilacus TaxID=2527982 RepID=A0A518C021_9BACT|nr:DUF3891 family protein [Mucisphaera calidilacus]QDU72572.1 hypothetical protein Pan265_24420 [Mucisphaera calidilacus]
MLKTTVDQNVWLVPQHTHAQVSGYLAAYWGNHQGFARPGHYPGSTHPHHWRDEVVLGIAEHDNGWWEYEATPRFNPHDGLPVGLGESIDASPADDGFDQWRSGGFERWHLGINRLAEHHPYAALLIVGHAYWLYAPAFDHLMNEPHANAFRHAIFGDPDTAEGLAADRDATLAFLHDMAKTRQQLIRTLNHNPHLADATRPQHLNPHIRLTQTLDTLSLLLARNDTDTHLLHDVPRAGWHDRVTLRWQHLGHRRYQIDPYPFEIDPLPVTIPAKTASPDDLDPDTPMTTLHRLPHQTLTFEITSATSTSTP